MTMTVTYTKGCKRTGLIFRIRYSGVATIRDEPYPPGGALRVLRDVQGKILAGPSLDDILSWDVQP
jgi:hypothetical protein